jgi:hypothetical protein
LQIVPAKLLLKGKRFFLAQATFKCLQNFEGLKTKRGNAPTNNSVVRKGYD